MSTENRTLSAARWSSFSAATKIVTQVIQIFVLARFFLTPDEFGLLAIFYSLLAFLHVLLDFGIAGAVMHYEGPTKRQLAGLFWANTVLGMALAISLASLSSFLSDLYGDFRLGPLIYMLGVALFISSLGYVLKIYAEKQLSFTRLAISESIAAAIGFTVTIVLAFLGYGVESVAFGVVANVSTLSVLYWLNFSQYFNPFCKFKFRDINYLLKFGSYMLISNVMGAVHAQLDVLIGAKFVDLKSLGYYGLSKDIVMKLSLIVNPLINRVSLPVMAQDGIENAKENYITVLKIVTALNYPIILFLFFFSAEFISVFLGDNWTDMALIMKVICCWALLRSFGNPVGTLLIVFGKARLLAKWNAILFILYIPVVLVASQFGGLGLAIGMLVLMILVYIPLWYFLIYPQIYISLMHYTNLMVRPLALSLISYGSVMLLVAGLESDVLKLVIGAVLGSVSYLLLSYHFNNMWITLMSKAVGLNLPRS